MLIAAAAFGCAGCASLLLDTDKPVGGGSPLRAAEGASDGVRFEVYWAHLPPSVEADDQAELWRYVQEERLDERLRESLRRHGLRAGVVGGVPPRAITQMLNPTGVDPGPEGSQDAVVATVTGVTRQAITVRPVEAARVTAAPVTARVNLFFPGDGEALEGETFRQVEPIYRLGVEPHAGGGQTVWLAPELHHGEARMQWVADATGAIARPKPMRDVRSFEDLRIEARLAPGEMIVATSLPGADLLMGGFFHRADQGADGARKAIVVRMVRAPASTGLVAEAAGRSDRPHF